MRITIYIISLFGIFSSFGALGQTNDEYLIKTYQARHQNFEWHFSFARMLATPEWNMDSEKIPLSPDKAWLIAENWFKTNNCSKPELVSIEIRPFMLEHEAVHEDQRLAKRFYYRIECIPGFLDSMIVFVLMDGTVVEPIQEPRKGLW